MRILLAVALLLPMSACTTLGPRAIEGSRTAYNVALSRSDDEQLLLNLVRLRYRDRVLFLESSALTTQYSLAAGIEGNTALGDDVDLYTLGGSLAIEENPTITYTPLQGADFVERVLEPVKLETLFLLDASGWSSERLLRVLVQQMNGVKNAPAASGPTPSAAPDFEQFLRATRLLRRLELDDLVVGVRTGEGLSLHFAAAARSRPEFQELTRILDLNPQADLYAVDDAIGPEWTDGRTLHLRFRSFAGAMYYLSQSVEVPERDVRAGRVTVTRDPTGTAFDWGRVTEGLLQVRSSDKRPANAAVAVLYRGSWFYIDDSDLDSKSTFTMLGQIFALQSGNANGAVPLLTLPIGG